MSLLEKMIALASALTITVSASAVLYDGIQNGYDKVQEQEERLAQLVGDAGDAFFNQAYSIIDDLNED